jgi:sulfotransferase
LQNILAQNPDIYATPTSGVLELIFASRQNYTDSAEFKAQDSDLMRIAFLNYCKQGIIGFYNAISNRKYVVDKSRGWGIHYDFLQTVLGEQPKIICMVRDLRDVFASMENNFRKQPEKAQPIVNWAEMRGTSVPKRIDVWSQSPPIGLAIERLQEIIRLGNDKRILFVKYEDLCLNPTTEMIRIYQYLDIDYFAHDFENIVQFTKEDDTVYGAFGDHTIRHQLKLLPSKAKQLLGKEVTDCIFTNYKWFNDYFKYTK